MQFSNRDMSFPNRNFHPPIHPFIRPSIYRTTYRSTLVNFSACLLRHSCICTCDWTRSQRMTYSHWTSRKQILSWRIQIETSNTQIKTRSHIQIEGTLRSKLATLRSKLATHTEHRDHTDKTKRHTEHITKIRQRQRSCNFPFSNWRSWHICYLNLNHPYNKRMISPGSLARNYNIPELETQLLGNYITWADLQLTFRNRYGNDKVAPL